MARFRSQRKTENEPCVSYARFSRPVIRIRENKKGGEKSKTTVKLSRVTRVLTRERIDATLET